MNNGQNTFKAYTMEPPNLKGWISEKHLVRVVNRVVEEWENICFDDGAFGGGGVCENSFRGYQT